jgi:hypothetical protein
MSVLFIVEIEEPTAKMKLTCRNYLPLLMEGSQRKMLPMFVYILLKDLPWANDVLNQFTILKEIQKLVLANIEDIERKSKLIESKVASSAFTRISGSNIVMAAFSTRQFEYSSVVQLVDNTFQFTPHAQFALHLWIFPFDQDTTTLPIDDI